MRFDQGVIHDVVRTWDKVETQDLIQALVADIKKHARHTSNRQEQEFLAILAEQVKDRNFWSSVNALLHINLDF